MDTHLYQGMRNIDHAMATTPMKKFRCCGTPDTTKKKKKEVLTENKPT
jgi:hypothetical protein